MDPLSVTASVIAIIGLATEVVKRCKDYASALKDAPTDLCNILIEVGSVKCILETLEMRRNLSPTLQGFGADGPVEGCHRSLKALIDLLPKPTALPSKRKRGQLKTATYAKLLWPFKEDKARKILENLGRHKATIVLILTSDAGQDIKSIKTNLEGIVGSLSDQESNAIFKWLVTTDPSSNHNRACQLHEDHTGQWLIRSAQYNDWLGGSNRFLWLHGIPGAGKTVLASFIVQNAQRFCEGSDLNDIGSSYYYCYFGRSQDETNPFLRWIISQLCRQLKYIPEKLGLLSKRGVEPGSQDLLDVLTEVVKKFRRVYIIVDALDESQDRRFLLNLLIKFASDKAFEKISLMVFSREERGIHHAFDGICTSMSLSNPLVDEDIRVYIESQLQTDCKLSRWPDSLKTDIRDALVKGANGMFRWVACQLEILGRVNSRPEIRKALRELPATLEDTYERILTKIPPSNRHIAHKALQIIAIHSGITINKLAETMAVDTDQCSFSVDSRLLDPMDLLENCTCLARVDEHGSVFLSHYSVREYLYSDRILNGAAAAFKMSTNDGYILWSKVLITYLLNFPYQKLPTAEEFFSHDPDEQDKLWEQTEEEYPLLDLALCEWAQYCGRAMQQDLIELVLNLLDPRKDHFRCWEEQNTIANRNNYIFFRLRSIPGHEASVTLALASHWGLKPVVEELLIQNAKSSILESRVQPYNDFIEHCPFFEDLDGPPLQVAAMVSDAELVATFLRYGADPNASHQGWTVLTSTLRSQAEFQARGSYADVVRLLLQAGANPNPSLASKSPLQLAVERDHDVEVVDILLTAGADVNAVGDKEAVIFDMESANQERSGRSDGRNIESYCDTPLLIAEKMIKNFEVQIERYRDNLGFQITRYREKLERFTKVQGLLIRHGGVAYSRLL